ncbi:MAG TPA: type II toxin-antitoxin system RelE/ParE family toxin [Sulfurospirillum arcachonense]|nr:type II toxin-antitoxin system RelE/ParE family toxin [Sulfurospirillum arcachonense]HIP45198.1 type II toxin-antitoxin system RelE/ParE family toxin [Sulfurospirillum arcachonense]
MSYKLSFLPKALKEWKKLDSSISKQFKKKLVERLENPRVEKDKLRGFDDVYKVKLRNAGYRLAYKVKDEEITIVVLVVGMRDKNKVYDVLKQRFDKEG